MLFRKQSFTIIIRNFEPLIASKDPVDRKNKLKEEIAKQIKNLDEIREFCQGKKLSIIVQFLLYDGSKDGNQQPEGRIKKDHRYSDI